MQNENQNEIVDAILFIAEQFLGIPYKPWDPNVTCYGNHGPFWAFHAPCPTLMEIKKGQMNCAGFINLLRRVYDQEIPGVYEESYYAGGTYEWYIYLDSREILIPFDKNMDYPRGTLLLRKYRDEKDDGHLAIITGKGTVIHSIKEKGVVHDSLWPGYYEYVCFPMDWIGFNKNFV